MAHVPGKYNQEVLQLVDLQVFARHHNYFIGIYY